ncbi:MAG: shikimate dehydrogenase [Chloroflexi bacterium]|nr:shikimate dehydrogenase [Chloroflexota bacterium]
MIQLGLTGYPVRHSLSPKIHAAALKACGLDGDYSLFPIAPDDKQELEELLSRVRSGRLTGLNVTIPHKQNVIEFMDDLTPAARAIGAVNIVYLRGNRLVGDNTDAPGFLSDLNKFIGHQKLGMGKSALVLGAGGSARAVVYALMDDGWKVTIAARRIEQAGELVLQFGKVDAVELNFQTLQSSIVPLIVNTTPVGMAPNMDQSPWPENLPFPNASVYDLIYHPSETKLVRNARAQGLKATTGLGMLVEQAALGFELWTGCQLPVDIFRKAVE